MGQHFDDLGKLILRLAIGGLLLFHGVYKVRNGIDIIEQTLVNKGLPTVLKYGVYVGEVAAPVLVIIGFMTRIGGLIIAGNMVMAIYLVFGDKIFSLAEPPNPPGGAAIELPLLYLAGGLALFFLGGGKFALWRRGGPLG